MNKFTRIQLALFTLASLLANVVHLANAQVMPDFKPSNYPVASTIYWFSSVEMGVCFQPAARVASVKGALHCNYQENYDLDNNTWTLPQTCVALVPIGSSLSTAVRDSCANAKGTFDLITPAEKNIQGSKAFGTFKQGAASGSGTTYDDQPDTNAEEGGGGSDDGSGGDDGGEKKSGGLLGLGVMGL